jgi:hypothetical protein
MDEFYVFSDHLRECFETSRKFRVRIANSLLSLGLQRRRLLHRRDSFTPPIANKIGELQVMFRPMSVRNYGDSLLNTPNPWTNAPEQGRQKKGRPKGAALPYSCPRSKHHFDRNYPSISCSSFLAISSIFSGGQPGMSMPRRRPMLASTSLISLRLLRPKFGVRSISASVFWTRSPM